MALTPDQLFQSVGLVFFQQQFKEFLQHGVYPLWSFDSVVRNCPFYFCNAGIRYNNVYINNNVMVRAHILFIFHHRNLPLI